MYKEPWFDIKEYEIKHKNALKEELKKELDSGHLLFNNSFEILAKREDKDEILVFFNNIYIIVHLTWSSKTENLPFPKYKEFTNFKKLKEQLSLDSEDFI